MTVIVEAIQSGAKDIIDLVSEDGNDANSVDDVMMIEKMNSGQEEFPHRHIIIIVNEIIIKIIIIVIVNEIIIINKVISE